MKVITDTAFHEETFWLQPNLNKRWIVDRCRPAAPSEDSPRRHTLTPDVTHPPLTHQRIYSAIRALPCLQQVCNRRRYFSVEGDVKLLSRSNDII
jgi:hypothetical protein